MTKFFQLLLEGRPVFAIRITLFILLFPERSFQSLFINVNPQSESLRMKASKMDGMSFQQIPGLKTWNGDSLRLKILQDFS
jgi:hypothetical protein